MSLSLICPETSVNSSPPSPLMLQNSCAGATALLPGPSAFLKSFTVISLLNILPLSAASATFTFCHFYKSSNNHEE